MTLRETGSIHVHAPPDRVQAVLALRIGEPVRPGRFEKPDATYVVVQEEGGTRLVLARTRAGPALPGPREDLRHLVESELHAVRKLIDEA